MEIISLGLTLFYDFSSILAVCFSASVAVSASVKHDDTKVFWIYRINYEKIWLAELTEMGME